MEGKEDMLDSMSHGGEKEKADSTHKPFFQLLSETSMLDAHKDVFNSHHLHYKRSIWEVNTFYILS